MKRAWPISVLLIVTLFLAAGPAESTSGVRVRFYGRVFDPDLGTPVAGAVVRVWAWNALSTMPVACTNWRGYYEDWGRLPPGWYWLRATHKSQESRIQCVYHDGVTPVHVDFSLGL